MSPRVTFVSFCVGLSRQGMVLACTSVDPGAAWYPRGARKYFRLFYTTL